jgi:hypothetical protein
MCQWLFKIPENFLFSDDSIILTAAKEAQILQIRKETWLWMACTHTDSPILKGPDDGIQHLESLALWTSFIVRNSKQLDTQTVLETGSDCVFRWGKGDTYSVGSLKKC